MDFTQLLSCPQCSSDLKPFKASDKAAHCTKCEEAFPVIDGVPWLFKNPGLSLAEWRLRFDAMLAGVSRDEDLLKQSQKGASLSELTVKRLRKLIQAKVEQKKLLSDLMTPLLREPKGDPARFDQLKARDIAGQSISGYYTNIHRDWAWSGDENETCFAAVREALLPLPADARILVLGCGAGRLAYDLHQFLSPKLTVALDINPLMILAARRITKGRNVKLYEFPIAPKDLENHAVLQTCRVSTPANEGLQFLLADAFDAPIKKGQFDLVLTPWFIDIVPQSFVGTAAVVNNLLKPNGQWVNFGSAAFNFSDPTQNLSIDECLDALAKGPFKVQASKKERLPYMQSPHSAHGRIEETWTFCAIKTGETEAKIRASGRPLWLEDHTQPVPLEPVFQTSTLVYGIYLDVLKALDGKASIKDIAATFAQKHGLPAEEAAVSVANFLERARDSAARGSQY